MPVKKPPTNSIWKIQRKADSLFSNGTSSYPKFSKDGKSWGSEQKLLTHLSMVKRFLHTHKRFGGAPKPHPYLGCEIVQFKLTEEVKIPFEDYGD